VKWLTAVCSRALALALLWVALAGWSADYALYGVISVALATGMSLALMPPRPPRPRLWVSRIFGTLGLFGWFLWQSVRGGVDVALRALKPTVDVAPRVVVAPIDLPPGSARQIALILMNLMPGSMVQRLITTQGESAHVSSQSPTRVELHTLSLELHPADQWEQLQRRAQRAVGSPPVV